MTRHSLVSPRCIFRTMVHGCLEFSACMNPVNRRGVLVRLGEIAAGGGGVIAVPPERACGITTFAGGKLLGTKPTAGVFAQQ